MPTELNYKLGVSIHEQRNIRKIEDRDTHSPT